MKRSHLLVLLGVCFGLAAFGATVFAQRPGGQGQGQGQRQGQQGQQREIPANFQIMRIQQMTESMQRGMWAYVSLEMDTSDEQLIALRPILAKSWKETQAIFTAAEKAGDAADVNATQQSVGQNLSALRESVREQMSDEQKKVLGEWLQEQAAAIQRQAQRFQRFGGGGRGGDFQGQRQRGGGGGERTAPREGRRPAPEAERDNDGGGSESDED